MSEEEQDLLEDGEEEHEGAMSFLQHLEELRWRFVYAIGGILLGTIVTWIFIDFLVDNVLLIPAQTANIKLQNAYDSIEHQVEKRTIELTKTNKQLNVEIDKRKINLQEPIKRLGEYDIAIRVRQDVNAIVKLEVKSSEVVAAPAAAEEAKAEEANTEEVTAAPEEASADTSEETTEA